MSAVLADPIGFRDALAHAGRSDYIGAYHATQQGRSSIKDRERERVLDFILRHDIDHVRLLSLPGIDWAFEHLLFRSHPKAQVVGLEHSFSAFARARRAIPMGPRFAGLHPGAEAAWRLQDRDMQFGNGHYTYSRIAAQRHLFRGTKPSTRSNRLLLMSADTYATMMTTDYGATFEQKQAFRDRFYVRNAVWLDFTSQLGCKNDQAIANLHICMEANVQEKPVVLTVLNGRDAFHGISERIAHIARLQPAFQLRDAWTYVGVNGSSMLTVCGVIL